MDRWNEAEGTLRIIPSSLAFETPKPGLPAPRDSHVTFRSSGLDRVDVHREKTRRRFFPRRGSFKALAACSLTEILHGGSEARALRGGPTSREIYRPPLIIGMRNELHIVGGLTKCRDDGIVTVAAHRARETRISLKNPPLIRNNVASLNHSRCERDICLCPDSRAKRIAQLPSN